MTASGSEKRPFRQRAKDLRTRFGKIEGIDYKRGATEYVQKLDQSNKCHLYTKPFYNLANKISRWTGNGLDEDTHRHFCDFSNMAYTLALPAGSSILDVGCGSGWLCEYFGRLGYKMTGIDLSPEMVAIARERIDKIPYGVDHETSLNCRFLVHDIEAASLSETFDAIICYDSLHHFEDEDAVLRNIGSMLNYGGQLFVLEGEKPPEGSATENELRDAMLQYETLESPFSRDYLLRLLQAHGFAITGDYTSAPGFVDRENFVAGTIHFAETPAFNYLLCKKASHDGEPTTIHDSRDPGLLRAKFLLQSDWLAQVPAASDMEISLVIENQGDTLWLVSRAPLTGRVRLASKLLNSAGETIEEIHGVPAIQQAVAPGEQISLQLRRRAPDARGRYTLEFDLVNQNICWFGQQGSEPLRLSFAVL